MSVERTPGGLPIVEGYVACYAGTEVGGKCSHAVALVNGVLALRPVCNQFQAAHPGVWNSGMGKRGKLDPTIIPACRTCARILTLQADPGAHPGAVQCKACGGWRLHLRNPSRGLCWTCLRNGVDITDYPPRYVPARDRVEDFEFLRDQMGFTLTQAAEHMGVKRDTLYAAIVRERKRVERDTPVANR